MFRNRLKPNTEHNAERRTAFSERRTAFIAIPDNNHNTVFVRIKYLGRISAETPQKPPGGGFCKGFLQGVSAEVSAGVSAEVSPEDGKEGGEGGKTRC